MTTMRIIVLGTLAVALLAMPPVAATAAEDQVTNDFTKDMGKWKLDKAEGKVGAEGLKITKVEQYGGVGWEGRGQDLSEATAITVELTNTGAKDLALTFRIRSPAKKADEDFKLAAGKSMTYTFNLAGREVDLKKVTLVRLFAPEAGDAGLIVKNITVVRGASSQPASGPATAPK